MIKIQQLVANTQDNGLTSTRSALLWCRSPQGGDEAVTLAMDESARMHLARHFAPLSASLL